MKKRQQPYLKNHLLKCQPLGKYQLGGRSMKVEELDEINNAEVEQ